MVIASIAVALGLGNVYLYRELRAARSQARAQLSACAPTARSPLPVVTTSARPLLPEAASAPAPTTSINAAVSGGPRPSLPSAASDELRDYFTRKRYDAVFRELSLSDDDITAMLSMLSEQEQRGHKPVPKSRVAADGSILPDPDQARLRAEDQREIAALIGPERAATLMAFRETLPARTQLRSVRMRLGDSSEPLSEQQSQQLMAALSASHYSDHPTFVEGESPEERSERMRTWMSATDRQVREDAASILTPGQLKTLDEEMAFQQRMFLSSRPEPRLNQGAAGSVAP